MKSTKDNRKQSQMTTLCVCRRQKQLAWVASDHTISKKQNPPAIYAENAKPDVAVQKEVLMEENVIG